MDSSLLTTIAPYLFAGVFILVAVFIGFTLFTKKGRRIGPEILFGGKVVEDFGEIANNPLPVGSQKLTLLGCDKNGQKFLIIEVKTITPASINISWVKVDDKTLDAINNKVKANS